jgi:hypothetical protein
VTGKTFLVGDLAIKDPSNFVRLVTVHTNRHFVRLFFPQLASDYLLVNRLDAAVAFLTGGCNIVPENA